MVLIVMVFGVLQFYVGDVYSVFRFLFCVFFLLSFCLFLWFVFGWVFLLRNVFMYVV